MAISFGIFEAAIVACWLFNAAQAISGYFKMSREAGMKLLDDAAFLYSSGLASMLAFIPLAFAAEAFKEGNLALAGIYIGVPALIILFAYFAIIRGSPMRIKFSTRIFFIAYLLLEIVAAFATKEPGRHLAGVSMDYVIALCIAAAATVIVGMALEFFGRKETEFYRQACPTQPNDTDVRASMSVPFAAAFVVLFSLAFALIMVFVPKALG